MSGFAPSASNQVGSNITATSFSDTGLSPSTTYFYIVQAVDSFGTSAASAQASAKTSAASTGGGTCHVTYTISPQNTSAFGAAISISNTGTSALTSWTLTWKFANGQTVTSLWNGMATQSGANVSVANMSYNGNIAPGATLSGIGFNGTWNGTTNAVPASFAINGTTCN
jgi:hypothetical protein